MSEAIEPFNAQQPNRWIGILDFSSIVFLRLVSLVFLFLTIYVWLKAVGFWGEDAGRFDLLNGIGKTYTALLAILLPVTSVGLWTTLAWGRVVWFLAVGVQLLAFVWFYDDVSVNQQLLLFHVFSIAFYLTLKFGAYLIEKKE